MRYLLVLLFSMSCCFASVTWKETTRIYDKLIQKNHLNRPRSLYIVYSPQINAAATPENDVVVTSGALMYLNKEEMALMLGHELAHLQNMDPWYKMPGKFQEDRADYWGGDYIKPLGYNKCKAGKFLLKMKSQSGDHGGPDDTHSSYSERYRSYCNEK